MTANAATPRRPSRQSVLERWAAICGSKDRNEAGLAGPTERMLGTLKASRLRRAGRRENLEKAWKRTRGRVQKRTAGLVVCISSAAEWSFLQKDTTTSTGKKKLEKCNKRR